MLPTPSHLPPVYSEDSQLLLTHENLGNRRVTSLECPPFCLCSRRPGHFSPVACRLVQRASGPSGPQWELVYEAGRGLRTPLSLNWGKQNGDSKTANGALAARPQTPPESACPGALSGIALPGDKEPPRASATRLPCAFRLPCLLLTSPVVERNVGKRNGTVELHTVGAT